MVAARNSINSGLTGRRQTWFSSSALLAVLLAGYGVAMFVGTHIPKVPVPLPGQSDKLVHLTAYGGLAVLLMAWQCSRRRVGLTRLLVMWLLLAGYGAFDEITQPFVGRVCDLHDWLSDLTGSAIGLAVAWPIASHLLRSISNETP